MGSSFSGRPSGSVPENTLPENNTNGIRLPGNFVWLFLILITLINEMFENIHGEAQF